MSTRLAILQMLADGQLHSGADIGRRLGVSRAAVHKSIKALSANGLGVRSVAGLGYRLDAPSVPLDRERIARALDSAGKAAPRIEVVESVDSTNRRLLPRALADSDPSGMVCLAEVQPQGRGRRGKSWVATPYENLMMSMAWRFDAGPAMVMGLSLAAGVAAARALEAYGVPDAGLKWPNDVLWRDRMTSSSSPVRTTSHAVSSLTPNPLPTGMETFTNFPSPSGRGQRVRAGVPSSPSLLGRSRASRAPADPRASCTSPEGEGNEPSAAARDPLHLGEGAAPAHPALATFAHPCAAESVRLRGSSMGRKLAGLLVDVHGEASGPCTVVVGIGVNCRISESDGHRIDQAWADLHTIMGATTDRNRLAALLIDRLDDMFRTYAVSGLAAFKAEWNRRHLYADKPVRLVRDQASFEGTVDGIDDHGALRLRDADGRIRLFHSGEVNLRAVAECVS